MRRKCETIMLFFFFVTLNVYAEKSNVDDDMKLVFNKPAGEWNESLPIGNGFMGGMIFGNTYNDHIQFNEISLCTGSMTDMGNYKPFGDIYIEFDDDSEYRDYKRVLSLNDAICRVNYKKNDCNYLHEYFVSNPDRIMVIRYSSTKPRSLNLKLGLKSAHNDVVSYEKDEAYFRGRFKNNLLYGAILKVLSDDGDVVSSPDGFSVRKSSGVTVLLSVGTSYIMDYKKKFLGDDPFPRLQKNIKKASTKSYNKLKNNHIKDYQSLYNKCLLSLGAPPTDVSLPEQLELYKTGQSNPWLEALLFQYGRYLLISSSRKGGLPANLQGLWNDKHKPAWYSQYTTNINLEMNYWPAEKTGLSECHMPMLNWVENIAQVQKMSSDSRLKTPIAWKAYSTMNYMGGNSGWALHLPGPAWLLQHFWLHYAYSGDKKFLKERAYPMLKEMTEFWENRLIEEGGKLMTPDGWSPEHGPNLKEGDRTPYPGVSYDQQVIYDLFSNYVDAADVLNVDNEYANVIKEKRSRLLIPKIGKWGQLQEWMEDWDNPQDNHRHLNYLFGVFPGRQISPITTPDLAEAALVSLRARGSNSSGWSTAWRINMYARLLQPVEAHKSVRRLISASLYSNLFDYYPPFQIDGNFGYTSGVAEMLIQSKDNTIYLLPALPEDWSTGYVQGLCAIGGFSFDMKWEEGKIIYLSVNSTLGGKCKLSLGKDNKIIEIVTKKGKNLQII